MQKTIKNKGITLIALVITIIVLLILAGISIQMLTGDNSILKQAGRARDETKINGAKEYLQMLVLEYEGDRYTTSGSGTLESFLRSKGVTVVDNGDGTLTATYDGYDFIIDKTTYEIDQDTSNKPKIEVAISEPDASNKVKITVTVSNASDFSKIDSIKVTNVNNSTVVDEKTDGNSSATFTVSSNGEYKVEVKATSDGAQKTGEKVANVANIPVTFATNYGTIEVIWLNDNTNTVSGTPNEPNMYSGFEKVAWRDNGTEFTPTQNSEWFEYKSISGTGDNTTSKWANAKNTADGSYFVWIPRFAYRIIYWDSESRNNIVGYFDGRGMVDVSGNVVTKNVNSENKQITLDSGVNTVIQNGIKYIVHPAFDDSPNNGGWKNKISGIWVAKYEMSREDYDSSSTSWKPTTVSSGGGNTEITSSNNTIIRTVSKPNVTSWRNIRIGYCYTNSYNYDRTKESHLMKNSEWGAVAYLTHSQYGRNGKEISVNQCGYITGAGRGTGTNTIYNSTYAVDSETKLPPTDQQFNGEIGKASSSTGNLYGIYDLSGGAWEYVASFNKLGNSSYVAGDSYGIKMTENAKDGSDYTSNEYVTVYSNATDTNTGTLLYNVGKVGDATKEAYKGSGSGKWFGDYTYFANLDHPFFRRGAAIGSNSYAGVFSSYYSDGTNNDARSFRVVLAQ